MVLVCALLVAKKFIAVVGKVARRHHFLEFLKLPDNSFIVKPGVSIMLPCSAVVGSDVLEWFYIENESRHSIWNSQNKSLSEPG